MPGKDVKVLEVKGLRWKLVIGSEELTSSGLIQSLVVGLDLLLVLLRQFGGISVLLFEFFENLFSLLLHLNALLLELTHIMIDLANRSCKVQGDSSSEVWLPWQPTVVVPQCLPGQSALEVAQLGCSTR